MAKQPGFSNVILTSFPRSGNTLIRSYIEKVSGIYTGSDCDVKRKLNRDLLDYGLLGEGCVDNRVFVIKTHYPERFGATKFLANKCIVIVRNPLDSITSLWNMVATGTHNCSIAYADYEKFQNEWDEYLRQEASVWNDFHLFWMDHGSKQLPTYFIRFEDLMLKPRETLLDLFCFLLD